MLELIDGPCKGVFYCKRAPIFLRAVIDYSGENDVLDQLDDTPRDSETVYVYHLEGEPGWIHIYGTKMKGFFATGTYRYLPDIYGDGLRDNTKWQAWATDHAKKEEHA